MRSLTRVAAIAAVVLGLVVSGACGSSTPDTSTGTTGTGGATSSSSSSTSSSSSSSSSGAGGGSACPGLGDACTDCLSVQCSAAYCTCVMDNPCTSLAVCTQGCAAGDTKCSQACFTAHPGGISDASLLNDCGAMNCGAECPGATLLTPCQRCAFKNCSMEANKCVANAECNALVSCVEACGPNLSCQTGCAAAHPAGTADAQALKTCAIASCAGVCP